MRLCKRHPKLRVEPEQATSDNMSPSLTDPIHHLLTSVSLTNLTSNPIQHLSTWACAYFDDVSQSTACITSSFGESTSTLLNKFWYTYSYIYKIITFWILLAIILIPTTKTIPISLHLNIGIISPGPETRPRSFTAMSNFSAITTLSFIFGPHYSSPIIN